MKSSAPIRVEDIALHPAFRRLATITGIGYDLRYATANNFDGRVLYGGIDCAWLRADAGIPTEWWHFDHGDRDSVRRESPRVV